MPTPFISRKLLTPEEEKALMARKLTPEEEKSLIGEIEEAIKRLAGEEEFYRRKADLHMGLVKEEREKEALIRSKMKDLDDYAYKLSLIKDGEDYSHLIEYEKRLVIYRTDRIENGWEYVRRYGHLFEEEKIHRVRPDASFFPDLKSVNPKVSEKKLLRACMFALGFREMTVRIQGDVVSGYGRDPF